MLKLYARYIETSDKLIINKGYKLKTPMHCDVEISDNKGDIKVVYSWYNSTKPSKRNKYIMHNCFRYKLIWKN